MERAVLKNFLNIHRKTPVLEPLSNKFAGLQACNLIEKRLQHRCFPVNIANFLRTPINNFLRIFVNSCSCSQVVCREIPTNQTPQYKEVAL